MERKLVYLDNAATTPVSEAVVAEMTKQLSENFGNPSSTHTFGRKALEVVDQARHRIAQFINARNDDEIIFTSGGSESNNTVLRGIAKKHNYDCQIITTAIEHPSILNTAKELQAEGVDVVYLPVDESGHISLAALKAALTDKTVLVSTMAVNNEVGTINDLAQIGQIVHEYNPEICFHVDAVQGLGNIDLDVQAMQIDFMSTSAHKINGPKYIGFLYEKTGLSLPSLITGGEQEKKRRAGTTDAPSIAGFGEAVKLLQAVDRVAEQKRYQEFQKIVLDALDANHIKYEINGSLTGLVSHHTLNLHLIGIGTYVMLTNLDLAGFAVSGGSACTAGSLTPSHVLEAMYGKNSPRIEESIRISFGRMNTEEEVVAFATSLVKIAKRLQNK
ncbi:cysteine desulfurase family protein [Lactobacillus mulieris]|uniref:Cysteine desulfurase n=1 Tax=Lactobacillus mulieris TaxID=2508708 RepID=A0AAW5WY99_9LACO|nr:cysteine desulfurase family protein [Lactobacillus mulieris]MCZ3622250.1 cysteine desulfurase [Lactobacillus mulieris]MCZ3623962.1 cysteine desulfurase [Lactobacillus mulieris]MCZ3636257.1 cysteine desulfurase [Lactobacillus mulieris]MCZ3689801.1 cysteine desulfurase [Lactobacillus mulieris]MCZ3695804.1 cysteine desulfurase [Lactobacillus mulieris]